MEKTLGSFVRARRQELGLNQTELGTLVGMKQTIISRIETGETKRLKKEQVRALASALECTTQEIETRLKPQIPAQPRTEFGQVFRGRREALGLSIPQLAKIAKVSQAVIRQLELKKSPRIHITTAVKFGTILEENLTRFVGGHRPTRKLPEIGRMVDEKRIDLGMSSDQLAQKVGVTRQHLSAFRFGKSWMSKLRLEALAKHLEIEMVSLMRFKPQRNQREKKIRVVVRKERFLTTLGNAIEKRCSELGISKKELAKQSGLSTVTIHNSATGKRPTSRKTLRKLKRVLGEIE